MKRQLICKGYPAVYVKSLDRKFKKDEKFFIEEEDIEKDLRKSIEMGLFDYLSLGGTYGSTEAGIPAYARGNQFFRDVQRGDSKKVAVPKPATKTPKDSGLDFSDPRVVEVVRRLSEDPHLTPDAFLDAVRKAIRDELKGVSTGSSKPRARRTVDEDVMSLDTTIFIRPDEMDLMGEVEIEGISEEDSSVDDAITKLKGKSHGKKGR